MMAWSPIILFALMMIGYPLIQLLAIWFRRPHRIKFRAFIEGLRRRYTTAEERQAIDKLMTDSRGYLPDPIVYLLLPFVVTNDVLKGARPHDPEELEQALRTIRASLQARFNIPADADIWADPELNRIILMSMKLRIVNSPISFIIGATLSVPAIWLARVINRDARKPDTLKQDLLSRFAVTDRAIFN